MTAHVPSLSFPNRASAGFAFLELVIALAVVGILVPPLSATLQGARTAYRLEGARERVAELLVTARWTAVASGGASVRIQAAGPRATLLDRHGVELQSVLLPRDVSLRLSRDRPEAEIRYGPLGLGVVSSQTIRFFAGNAERRLVVSSLGRVDRR